LLSSVLGRIEITAEAYTRKPRHVSLLRKVLAKCGAVLLGCSSCPGLFEHPLVLVLSTPHGNRALLLMRGGAALGHAVGVRLMVDWGAGHVLLRGPILLLVRLMRLLVMLRGALLGVLRV
jgi:hypothetical protein